MHLVLKDFGGNVAYEFSQENLLKNPVGNSGELLKTLSPSCKDFSVCLIVLFLFFMLT